MRSLLLTILLAGTAVSPALAQDRGGHEDRDGVRTERQQAREDRQQAREQVRAAQVAPQVEAHQQLQAQSQARGGVDHQRLGRADRGTNANQSAAIAAQQQAPRGIFGAQQRADQSRGSNGWTRDGNRELRQSDRAAPNVMRQRNPVLVDQSQQRVRTEGRRWSNSNWNSNWRNDRRYDWHNYRNHHRSTFHLGLYYDPFGYGYQSFNIGYQLYPNYYSRQYWIDPAMYQLPYPPPGTTWVRYWNDALLVDTYSGEVVDVIHNFFW